MRLAASAAAALHSRAARLGARLAGVRRRGLPVMPARWARFLMLFALIGAIGHGVLHSLALDEAHFAEDGVAFCTLGHLPVDKPITVAAAEHWWREIATDPAPCAKFSPQRTYSGPQPRAPPAI